ncbi:hypothetical protein GJAV_G00111090 [Gymnothorax javanicus]|nr:hypothetical protein GJAV_G00111090 [Gymnothorax javanicus]
MEQTGPQSFGRKKKNNESELKLSCPFVAEMMHGTLRGRFTMPVSRPYESSYDDEYQSYTDTDDTMAPSSGNGEVSHGYVRRRLGPPDPRPLDLYGSERRSYLRSGPYESYDSGPCKDSRDLHRSGFGSSYDDGYDSPLTSARFYREESSWDSSYPSSAVTSGFSDKAGQDGYSTYSSSASPHATLAPVGSRGRGMPAYPQNSFAGRSNVVGGPPALGGRGRGFIAGSSAVRQPLAASPRPQAMERGKFAVQHYGTPLPEFYGGYQLPPQPSMQSMKRKMLAPPPPVMMAKRPRPYPVASNTPVMAPRPSAVMAKKPKPVPANQTAVSKSPAKGLNIAAEKVEPKSDETNDSQETKRRNARREKQRRKRAKEIEKYGDMHRMGYMCAFCKVRTSNEKEMEEHFSCSVHQETLAYIQKQAKFEDTMISFLHEAMVNKFRKSLLWKRNNNSSETALEEIQRELTTMVQEEACLTKVEMVNCLACDTRIPAALVTVRNHLNSSEHLKKKAEYTEIQKRECVLTATSIMNNPIMKTRFEKYQRGENPFDEEIKQDQEESQEEPQEEQAVYDQNQETN